MKPVSIAVLQATILAVIENMKNPPIDERQVKQVQDLVRMPLELALAMLTRRDLKEETVLQCAYHYIKVARVLSSGVPDGKGHRVNYSEETGLEALSTMAEALKERFADRD